VATIEGYTTSGGKRYRVRYRKPDHSQTTKRGFKTKREAEIYLATVELGKASGSYIDPSHSLITIGSLGENWLSAQAHLKPSSVAVMESAWRLHVKPIWGQVPVGDVRHSDVQKWLQTLAAGGTGRVGPKSATLVHRAHGVLSSILQVAVRDRRIGANPAKDVGLPRRVSRPHRYLTHTQVHVLAEACKEHGTLIRVLAYTGLRWGEATALTKRDLEPTRRRIAVERNAVYVNGQTIVGTPKTYQQRVVPYPEFLDGSLQKAAQNKDDSELLFPGPLGGYLETPTMRQRSWFDKALQEAKLPPMTIHDLRHTAASLAISSGANVKAVQRMLGHASAAMTLDTYADLFDDDLDSVAMRLSEAATSANVVKMWSKNQIGHSSERPT
jgi:integrase